VNCNTTHYRGIEVRYFKKLCKYKYFKGGGNIGRTNMFSRINYRSASVLLKRTFVITTLVRHSVFSQYHG